MMERAVYQSWQAAPNHPGAPSFTADLFVSPDKNTPTEQQVDDERVKLARLSQAIIAPIASNAETNASAAASHASRRSANAPLACNS
jgi:hypothetical protein